MARVSTSPPAVANRSTDVDIPRSVWSAWRPDHGARCIRRELLPAERLALEARVAELAPALAPFGNAEVDRVVMAISGMFGGFTSMRHTDSDAAGRIEAVMRVLAEWPAWAIVKACTSIQRDGVWRNGRFDRQWPPNDSEIVDAVRREAALYADPMRSARDLLNAEVER